MPAVPSFLNGRKLDLLRPASRHPQEHVSPKILKRCARPLLAIHAKTRTLTNHRLMLLPQVWFIMHGSEPPCPARVVPLAASGTCNKNSQIVNFPEFFKALRALQCY